MKYKAQVKYETVYEIEFEHDTMQSAEIYAIYNAIKEGNLINSEFVDIKLYQFEYALDNLK